MTILLYLAIGLSIGLVSGAVGIGGGVLLLPALIWLCGKSPREAAGTSLAILIPPIGLPAAWKYYSEGHIDLEMVLWIAGAFAVGGYFGAIITLRHYLPDSWLRLLFGLLMIYIAMRFIVGSASESANAVAGLVAALFAWLGYWGLRTVGRRHLPRPDLGSHIRTKHEQGHGDIDYHI